MYELKVYSGLCPVILNDDFKLTCLSPLRIVFFVQFYFLVLIFSRCFGQEYVKIDCRSKFLPFFESISKSIFW
jgi:hypothetical protein